MDLNKQTKDCLMCFNNTEKCVQFPLDESEKILNNLLTYLDPSVAIKPVCNNDQLFFCNHCFDFTSQLSKLGERLEILQNRISTLSSTFSRAIVFRRKLFNFRNSGSSYKAVKDKPVSKKCKPIILDESLPGCSLNQHQKGNQFLAAFPKANSNGINGNNPETDLNLANQEMNIIITSDNELVKCEDEADDCIEIDEDDTDIFIHKTLSNSNINEVDIENVKFESVESGSGVLDAGNEEDLTDLQENQPNFSPVPENCNDPSQETEIIDLCDDDDEITVLSDNSDDIETSEEQTKSVQTPAILPGTVRRLSAGEVAAEVNELEKAESANEDSEEDSDSDDLNEVLTFEEGYSSTPYKCSSCSRAFKKISNLREHMTIHTGEKPFKCKYCDRRFGVKGMRTKHENTHTCPFCKKVFPQIEELEAHKKTHTKLLKCIYCEKTFYGTNSLKLHERTHKGEQNYKCSYCGEIFLNNFKLKEHEREHTGERPFQCSFCVKKFTAIESLIQHEKIHTRELE